MTRRIQLKRDEHLSMEGLILVKVRKVNGRIVGDLMNELGDLVLSGDTGWIWQTADARGYIIHNEQSATEAIERLQGTYGY